MTLRLAALAIIATLASVALADTPRTLSGTVLAPDSAELMPGTTLLVEVTHAGGGAPIAEARLPLDGATPPLSFRITLPPDATGTLRAGLSRAGIVAWQTAPVEITDTTDGPLGALPLQPRGLTAFPAAFRCGDRLIRLGFAGETAILDTGTARLVLQPVPAASGARYAASDDPDISFWSQGDTATLTLSGDAPLTCHAALPKPTRPYSASGNEPFWSVTVSEDQMTLVRLGMDDLTLPLREAGLTAEGAIMLTAADRDRGLRAVLLRRPTLCRDSMTGMPHPETVALSMGDHTIRGCGGDPWSLLTGRTWRVVEIDGADVIADASATLTFDAAGRVAGSGSCNRITGVAKLTGETLSLGPIAGTRMACPDAVMAQEQRFLAALADVTAFDIDATGALVLLGPDGPRLTARATSNAFAP